MFTLRALQKSQYIGHLPDSCPRFDESGSGWAHESAPTARAHREQSMPQSSYQSSVATARQQEQGATSTLPTEAATPPELPRIMTHTRNRADRSPGTQGRPRTRRNTQS